jgi:hypothetical protein
MSVFGVTPRVRAGRLRLNPSPRAQQLACEVATLLVVAMLLRRTISRGGGASSALVLGFTVLVPLLYLARRFPMAGLRVGLVVLCAVPIYWGRDISGTYISSSPGFVVPFILLLPALGVAKGRFRWTLMDGLVVTFLCARILSALLHFDGPLGFSFVILMQMIVPYAVGRLYATDPAAIQIASRTLVFVAVPLGLVGLWEAAGTPNPFFSLVRPGYEVVWAFPLARFDRIRAESSFGHPIAFGMFLAFVLVLGFALVWASRARSRVVLGASLVVLVFSLLATLSRGPIAVLLLGAVVWFFGHLRRIKPHQVVVMMTMVVLLVVLTPAGATFGRLVDSLGGESSEASTAEHRLTVNGFITDSRYFSFLGLPAEGFRAPEEAARARAGLNTVTDTIDSEYSVLYVSQGLLPLLAFIAIGLSVWRTAFVQALGAVERAWAAATAAAFVGLWSVALITQYRPLFWIAIGAVGAIRSGASGLRAPREADTAAPTAHGFLAVS